MIPLGAALASRKEVAAAVESQPPGSTVLVSDGSKLLASRNGHGDSAVLVVLDADLAEQIVNGFPYNARPYLPPEIQAALKKRAKAERARNREAKRKTQPVSAHTRSLPESKPRATEAPSKVAEPEPPEPQASETSDRLEVV
jgi:hypothetical protein